MYHGGVEGGHIVKNVPYMFTLKNHIHNNNNNIMSHDITIVQTQ